MCVREKQRVRERELSVCANVLMCVCPCMTERERKEREEDDERLGLNHISKFGMSSDQRTAMVEKERKRRGNDTRATKLQSFLLPYLFSVLLFVPLTFQITPKFKKAPFFPLKEYFPFLKAFSKLSPEWTNLKTLALRFEAGTCFSGHYISKHSQGYRRHLRGCFLI